MRTSPTAGKSALWTASIIAFCCHLELALFQWLSIWISRMAGLL
jgi:hypothetical protein